MGTRVSVMNEFELKIHSRDINTLLGLISEYSSDTDTVRQAYDYAASVHKDQKRFSGEPFITHPLEVAIILAGLKLDITTIVAALLHDVVEDTGTTLDFIRKNFSDEIAGLVDGVTKISAIKSKSRATAQAETLRKMLIATIEDIRVIIIKLADKLHNMRTIMFLNENKRTRIAQETVDIYAPIARRLGMSKISAELEDLSFQVLHREDYIELRNMLAQRKNELEEYIENVRSIILTELDELEIEADITGRAKHYYSIYRKMTEQSKKLDEIYDIRAIRIISNEVRDCYAILGVIHTLWSPITARFKDYIAVPKSNMYQSLHTTVIGPEGHPLEIQIRTHEMHATAEMGIAAHWMYKDDRPKVNKAYKNLKLLKDINEWKYDLKDSREFMKSLKMDLYENEIFVFTPKGKIITLPQSATPVDFAYSIHTEVGNTTTGAKVNNRMVPLRSPLKSGDIVEIMTSKNGHPSEAWLKFVVSPNARYKIRNWIRRNKEAAVQERDTEKSRDKKARKEEKTAEVIIPKEEQIRLKKLSGRSNIGVSIAGTHNVLIRLSQCCQPIPGDEVVGFITRGRGITVHKKSCPSLKRLSAEKERFINIVWEDSGDNLYPVKIAVQAEDRPNLLKDITDEISLFNTNIIRAEAEVREQNNATLKFILEVKSNDHLKKIIARIKKIQSITDAYKLNEKVVLK